MATTSLPELPRCHAGIGGFLEMQMTDDEILAQAQKIQTRRYREATIERISAMKLVKLEITSISEPEKGSCAYLAGFSGQSVADFLRANLDKIT